MSEERNTFPLLASSLLPLAYFLLSIGTHFRFSGPV
jgi:hypothetical protein